MSKAPKLSIVIPTYNRADMLRQCLDSMQHAPADCEIVVLDNASPDSTPQLVKEFMDRDPRIRTIRHPQNLGPMANFEKALAAGTGEYLCMICDDDLFLPGNFDKKLKILDTHPEIGMVYSQWYNMDVNGNIQGVVMWPGILNYPYIGSRNEFQDLLPASYLFIQTAVIRRSLYEQVGGFETREDMTAGFDWEFLLRYCYHTKTAFINEPTVCIRTHEASFTESHCRKRGQFARGRVAIWRKWLVENDNPPVLDEAMWNRMANAFIPDLQHEFGNDIDTINGYIHQLEEIKRDSVDKVSRIFLSHLSSRGKESPEPTSTPKPASAAKAESMPAPSHDPNDLNKDDWRWDEIYGRVDLASIPNHFYNFTAMPFLAKYLQKAAELCPPGGRVLEPGIGFGYGAIWMSMRGAHAEGIDYSPPIVERAKRINEMLGGRAEFRYGDMFKLKECVQGIFDVTLHQGCLEHFSDGEIQEILRQQLEVSRRVVFSVPSINYPFEREFGNERLMTVEQWGDILKEFDIKLLSYYGDPALGGQEHVMGVLRGVSSANSAEKNGYVPLGIPELASADAFGDRAVTAIRHTDSAQPAIIWNAPLFDPSGYAEEARGFLLALDNAGYYISAQPIKWNDRVANLPMEQEGRLRAMTFKQPQPGSIHVSHILPPHFTRRSDAKINVGRTMFETDRIPAEWADACNMMDRIWVPSEFNRETFIRGGVRENLISIVPGTLDVTSYNPKCDALKIEGARGYNFLSIFDWSLRKGWDVLLRAYIEEFSASEDVSLIIKTHSSLGYNMDMLSHSIAKFIQEDLHRDLNDIPDLIIQATDIPATLMPNLYAAADCFVMPTRGEGWGRPFMEAMAMAKPVIGTNWSGNTAFMNAGNSYLLDYKLVDVPEAGWKEAATFKGHRWADPDVSHLRQLMRQVFLNRKEGAKVGKQAREDIAERFSYSAVSKIINAELHSQGMLAAA